jgi:hypothetical protein
MRGIRKAQFFCASLMTPTLIGLSDKMSARSVDTDGQYSTGRLDPFGTKSAAFDALNAAVFELSPFDKLKVAGDRIRIEEAALRFKPLTSQGQTKAEGQDRDLIYKNRTKPNSTRRCGRTQTC